MKAKIEFTFATKQFENIKPVVEFDIPEMDMETTYLYFHDIFSKYKEGDKKGFKKFDDMDDDEFVEAAAKLLEKKPDLKKWISMMYDKRGLDRDHTNGFDDGEGKEKKYEGKGTREHFTLEESVKPF